MTLFHPEQVRLSPSFVDILGVSSAVSPQAICCMLHQLLERGFPSQWCAEALTATQNNINEALTWILSNSVQLSKEDHEGMDEDDDAKFDEDEEEDEEEQPLPEGDTNVQHEIVSVEESERRLAKEQGEPNVTARQVPQADDTSANVTEHKGWRNSVTPVQFISGQSIINLMTLSISDLPAGGFRWLELRASC
jgi:hypothetical protein